eukprot:scaffold305_cov267-Chaetoceros_neogracile.AAC.19
MSTITAKNEDDGKHQCAACGDSDGGGGSLRACTACNLVKYCNRTCQVAHWPAHKKPCKKRQKRLAKHHCCAACGDSDDGGGSLKACTGCNLVEYCNRTCQAAHWPAHKKACKEERVAELFDEKLFKQPPPNEDCPICYLRLPIDLDQCLYEPCCGKSLCRGCVHVHSVTASATDKNKCVFCRTEASSSDEEHIERMKKRVEANDARSMFHLGSYYRHGGVGLRQDHAKALELYRKSAKLGYHIAHHNLSLSYLNGVIVEKDTRKATYYKQLGAMAGNVKARYNLGCDECNVGNMDRAYKHWMISANDGFDLSMKSVQEGYKSGFVTKDDYAKTIRAYGNSIDEMKSNDRERAAAFRASRVMGAVRQEDNL